MADLNNQNNLKAFEDVSIDSFIGNEADKDTALRHIVSKVALDNPTVTAGIESLMKEEVYLRSFRRFLPMLLLAKNEQHLQKVEAALQVTANEVKEYKAKDLITHKKLCLYLYTIQELILNLDKWEFPDFKINHYRPKLMSKLEDVRFKCSYLNIPEVVIRKECFSDAYKQPYDNNLRSFEYLDEQSLDNFAKRIHKYEITRNSYDLYHNSKLTKLNINDESNQTIERIIYVIEANLGIEELNSHYYTRNFHVVNEVIAKYIRTNDVYVIYAIAESLKQYLESREQFRSTLHRYHDGKGYTTY